MSHRPDPPGDAAPPLAGHELAAVFALMEVSSLLQYEIEQQLRRDGDLSWVQFQILAGLALDSPDGTRRLTDIADRVVYSRAGVTYQAKELEKAGLVSREPDPSDSRGAVLRVTPAGRELIGRVLPGHEQVTREMFLQHLEPDEISRITQILSGVRDRLRQGRPPRSAKPRGSTANPSRDG